MKKILRWLFGLSFLMLAINSFVKGDMQEKFAAILLLIDSLILIPISLDFIEQKMNYKLNRLTKYALVIILYFAAYGMIFFKVSEQHISKAIGSNSSIIDTTTNASDSNEVKPDMGIGSTKWEYHTQEDEMTSKKVFYASIEANDYVYLKFPYDGGVTATLNIRNKNGRNEAFLQVSKGQLMAANDVDGNGAIRLRFDDNKPKTYSVNGASDNSSETVFINSASDVIRQLKKSKKLIIEAAFYDNGIHVMEFNVSNFEFNH
jgi:hypothetical protein